MRIPTLGVPAMLLAMLLVTSVPIGAQAHDQWGHDRSVMHELRQACDWGNRRACIRLGREIEQRREARRAWRQGQWQYQHQAPWRGGREDHWRRGW